MTLSLDFASDVLNWFDHYGRHDLPWQHNPTPYRVWVSEIMLQQTQVATVIPYYLRFMTSFPTVEALAAASNDDVVQHWAGLGYYARARNLHHAAQQVVEQGGEFPRTLDGLMALKGIGRSTAGAILSLAGQQRGVIMDGNVKRVLARCFALEGEASSASVQQQLWALAEQLTPTARFAAYSQAMMDLGATVCTRSKPLCLYCPLQARCQAYALGTPTAFPEKKKTKDIPTKEAYFVIFDNDQGETLWLKRPPAGIWGSLWCLPEIAVESEQELQQRLMADFGVSGCETAYLPPFRHTFSHYHLLLKPLRIKAIPQQTADSRSQWCTLEQVKSLGLPKPMMTLLAYL